ncbi:MAG: hypothetical protein AAF616_05790 [Bacteroidota bacterium]
MSVSVYLLFDGEMKYSVSKDDLYNFKKLTTVTAIGCESGEEMNWFVSKHDEQIQSIRITNKSEIPGKKPVIGKWKNTWIQVPESVTDKHCKGIVDAPEATKEDPAVFAWELSYLLIGAKNEVSIDPGTWTPPPPPDKDPFGP